MQQIVIAFCSSENESFITTKHSSHKCLLSEKTNFIHTCMINTYAYVLHTWALKKKKKNQALTLMAFMFFFSHEIMVGKWCLC